MIKAFVFLVSIFAFQVGFAQEEVTTEDITPEVVCSSAQWKMHLNFSENSEGDTKFQMELDYTPQRGFARGMKQEFSLDTDAWEFDESDEEMNLVKVPVLVSSGRSMGDYDQELGDMVLSIRDFENTLIMTVLKPMVDKSTGETFDFPFTTIDFINASCNIMNSNESFEGLFEYFKEKKEVLENLVNELD